MKKNGYGDPYIMTLKQLRTELERCEYCEEKPCKDGCPCDCSPFDFIMAARVGNKSDIRRAAGEIMKNNPLGGVCGMVCPDTHCMARCSHKLFDGYLKINKVQASVVEYARRNGGIPAFAAAKYNGKKVAVVGAGPAGLSAAGSLAQMGYKVDLFEARKVPGGMMALIPDHRLDKKMMKADIDFVLSLGRINLKTGRTIKNPESLLGRGYSAVVVAAGRWVPIPSGIENEELATGMTDFLSAPKRYRFKGRVAVVGGGATAVDCAVTAKMRGAKHVELFMLETVSEMPLTPAERQEILDYDIEVSSRIRLTRINGKGRKITGIETRKVRLLEGKSFSLPNIRDLGGTDLTRKDINAVIIAIGTRPALRPGKTKGVFYAGDISNGPTTVVEASASGKNAALEVDAYLKRSAKPKIKRHTKSYYTLPGYNPVPVPLETDFFGRRIISPFLLSAAPPSDGLDQMTKAYEAGWAGGIMKTAFDGVPIHIPGEYMFAFSERTYANCDNVSGHSLDRVRREVSRLVKKWPDRLTMASTGGPVTGDDEADAKGWQSNTRRLESCGVMGIEYSLSCPQGGDGTEGDIVSQNAALTARIIDWVMQVSDPDIPKIFKLTAAVTSIVPILRAIRGTLEKYPGKKAGVTLANTFPTLGFRPATGGRRKWDEGVVVGMSGEGVTPISYLTLAGAVPEGIEISGNGGPMNYKAAADFLAIGVKTVQFCTIVMKYGYGIIHELESGVSYLMQDRGIRSMDELIGIAQPNVITDFMDLSPIKKISDFDHDLCVSCGNCARCPYLAIELDRDGLPHSDPGRCIGCSICSKKCFTGAIRMRKRTARELQLLKED